MKLALPLLVGLALASSGCVVHTSGRATVRTSGTVQARYTPPSYVVVSAPPPPLRSATVRTARPSTQAVWVDGYWDLRGNQWVWVDGHWFAPRAGHEWEPPVVVVVEGGGYQYHPGYWRGVRQAPPPVYRASGTVRVSVGQPPVVRVRPSEVNQSTVVVRPGSRTGPSANVTVRPVQPSANVTVRPAQPGGSVTVRPQPQPGGNVTVRPAQPQPGGNVTVRPQPQPGGNVTVRPQPQPSGNVTVRPAQPQPGGGNVTVRPQPQPGGNVTVRPAQPQPGGNVTVRPTQPTVEARPTTTQPNTTVRPTVEARPTTTQPNTTVRPTVEARPTTTQPNTTVRPTVEARPTTTQPNTTVQPAQPTVRPGATVQPGANVGMGVGMGPQVAVPVQCRPTIARVPQNGFLVLQGSGLAGATAVTLAGRAVPIASSQDDQIRARLTGVTSGGRVEVRIRNQTHACGTIDVIGR